MEFDIYEIKVSFPRDNLSAYNGLPSTVLRKELITREY